MNLDDLGSLPIRDETGRSLATRQLWEKQSVMVVFVRHFGCVFCRQQLSELREIIPEIRNAGVELAVIGNGTWNFIQGFKEAIGLKSLSVYTDPSLATYKAAGMDRGRTAMLDARWIVKGLKAFFSGHRQASTQGDALQLGGVLVVARGGRLLFKQASRFAGDHASPEQIRAAVQLTPEAHAGEHPTWSAA